jgi:PAS domain S-box-containing protein
MKDESKKQLIDDIRKMHQRIVELEAPQAEQKKAGEAQIENAEMWRMFLEAASDATILIDVKTLKHIDANEVALKLYGYSRAEFLSMKITDVSAEPDETLAKIMEGGKLVKVPLRHYRKRDGTVFPAEITARFFKLKGKKLLLIAVRDITDRICAEEQLRESEEKYRTIFNTAGTAMLIVEEDTTISLVNKEFEKLSAYPKEEIEGKKSWTEFFSKDSLEAMKEYHRLRRVDHDIVPKVYETVFIDKHGNPRDILLHVDMIPGTNKSVGSLLDITHQKSTEEALRHSEEKYRTLVERIPAITYMADLGDTRSTLYISPQVESILGFSPEDFKTDPNIWLKKLHPGDRKRVLKELGEAHSTGKPFSSEYRLVGPDGRVVWVRDDAVIIKDNDGKPLFLQGVLHDLTERKSSEETLFLLKKAVETIPIGLTITDTEGKIVYTNSAEAKMHGYAVDELIGKNMRIFAPREKWKVLPFEELKGLQTWSRQSLNIRENGEVFPVYLTSVPVTDAESNPIGIITVCQDITLRKLAEEKLEQRREALQLVNKLATTIGTSFKAVCDEVLLSLSKLLKSSHGLVLRFEDSKINIMSGINEQKLDFEETTRSLDFMNIFRPFKNTFFQGLLKTIFPEHPFAEYNLKSIVNIPVKDSVGNVVGAIIIMDNKEREFIQNEINLIEIFARYIAFEIERESMETRLQNAQKMEIIGKLAGGVAHEVRTPLNAIMVFTETLCATIENDSKYKTVLSHIRSQVDRLSALMKDLLNLGKPVDQSNLFRQSLNAICSSSIDIWKHSEISRAHTVIFSQSEDCGDTYVFADSQKLQQVFLNLLDNAAENSPEYSEIRITLQVPDRNMCKIQVVDYGNGVPEEILPRIFEPFFTTRRGGTGLGLCIVKHVIDTHGGRIEVVNNKPLPGCTVEIALPISDR